MYHADKSRVYTLFAMHVRLVLKFDVLTVINRFLVRLCFFVLAALPFLCLPSNAYPQQNGPLKIGVASMITPVDTVKYYQEIIDYVSEQIKQPVQMVHRRTYDEMDSLLERGGVKVAFVCSLSYVLDKKNFGVELLAAPSVNGKAEYHSYIIVHKDSPIKTFEDLKGKTFAFTDPRSNTGKLYPTYLLTKTGGTAERFFSKTIYSYSHNKSVELVAKKVVDGAAVESIVYGYMAQKGSPYALQTKIIKRSPPFGIPPVVVTRDIDPTLRRKIRDAFLGMSGTEKGKAILDAMMIDGFVPINDEAYNSIRRMERAVMEGPRTAAASKEKKTVYFGVVPRDNPRMLYEKYQPLLDYLSAKTPYSYELVIKKNYGDTVAALGNREMDLALLGPLTYLEARAKYGAICLIKPKGIDGTSLYRSVIIKNRDSRVSGIADLRGKSFAFSASRSASGNLMPRYMLAGAGIHLNELGNYSNFDYHDSVVKAVLRGRYDAGAVRDSVAEKYKKLGIVVIAESEPVPIGPLTAGPGASPDVIEQTKRALLELKPGTAANEAVLKKLDDDLKQGFTGASDKDYEGIRAKINAVPATCGSGCHPKIKL